MKMNAEKRFFALFLAIVMILSIMPLSAYAKTTLNTTVLDGKISIATTGGTSGQRSSSVNSDGSITVGVKAVTNCLSQFEKTANHTVTISNTTQEELMLEFDYTGTNLGTLVIDGTTMEVSGSFSKTLAVGASFTLDLTSASNTNETTVVLSGFELKDTGAKNVTILKKNGGSTTVNGTALTDASTTVTTDYVTGVTVQATPASGYVFLGWLDQNYNVVSTSASTVIHPLEEMSIAAYFVANDAQAYWLGGGKIHTDLSQATDAALNGDKKVVLLKNATLSEGTYTIPAGVKLIIPKDEAITTFGAEPALSNNGAKWSNPTAYRTLTLASKAKLVINGELELVAQHHVSAGSCLYGGAIDGAYGHIATAEGSAIEVYGTMYAWGIVSGKGVVTAYSGATIHEKMQINDYRGGTATMAMVTNSSKKTFPFSQYYVQNVETKEVIHAGASLIVNAGVYLSAPEQASITFVGTSGAMFTMAEGSVVTKDYDEANDRLVIDINGNTALNSITLSFQGQSIDSSKFRLGINNNIDIRIHSGITTINQEMVLQSGATVSVDREAVIYNATSVYVMDAEDWGTYARSKTLIPVKWSYANGTTVKRTTVTDAIVNVNGTIINNGQLFTTGSESVISSEKTGVIFYNTPANATATINQATANSATNMGWVTIDCTAAVLVNGDGTTITANGGQYDGFIYDAILDRWVQKNFVGDGSGFIATLNFNANGGTGSMAAMPMDYMTAVGTFAQAGIMPVLSMQLPDSSFVREGYTFIGWSANSAANAADFVPGDYITISQDHTLYAVWSANKYSLTIDGVSQDVPFGSDLSTYVPAAPSKDGFVFKGWTVTMADGTVIEMPATMPAYDVVITANWEQVKSYTLTFLDENGNVLGSYEYTEGQAVDATYPEYSKPNYTISWSADIPATLTGDMEISAIATANTYNITYFVDGAEFSDNQATESNNWTVSLPTPSKDGYTFLGWAYAADASAADIAANVTELALTGDVDLYAVWSLNSYTITWVVDGVSTEETYNYGATPVFTGSTDKANDGCTVYTFDGWDKDIVAVTGDATYTATYTTSLSHTEGETVVENATEATCTQGGSYDNVVYCSVCGEELSRDTVTVDALGHTDGQVVVENNVDPDCVNPGSYDNVIYCTVCGEELSRDTVPVDALGHTAGETVVENNVAPDCTNPGSYDNVVYCSVCGEELSRDTVPVDALGHGHTEGFKYIENVEYHEVLCADCGEYSYQQDHDYTKNHTCICGRVERMIITFMNGDEEWISTECAYNNTLAIAGMPLPTREGYTFAGWYTENGVEIFHGVTITEDVIAYATWNVNSYTITWNGVGEPIVQTYNFGDPIVAPADPTMEHYVFAGWINGEMDVPATMPAKDLVFDASWTPATYTISWDVDGDGIVDTTTEVTYNNYIGTMPEPVVPGMTATTVYSFDKWTDANGVIVSDSTIVTGDMTITANIVTSDRYYYLAGLIGGEWGEVEANKMIPNGDGTYTLEIRMEGGTYEFKVRSGDAWYGCNTTIVDSTNGYKYDFYGDANNCGFQSTGAGVYTFTWDTADNTLIVSYVPDHVHVYNATFNWSKYNVACEVTLTCDCNSSFTYACGVTAVEEGNQIVFTATYGEYSDSVSVDNNSTRAIYFDNSNTNWDSVYAYCWNSNNDNMVDWPGALMTKVEGTDNLYVIIVPTDYQYIIFNNGNGGIGNQSNDQSIPTNGCNTAVWYADNDIRWGYNEPAQYTITFEVDGQLTDAYSFYYGDIIDWSEINENVVKPEKEGYTFAGYDYSNAPTYVNGDITITGSFTINTYTITWIVDGVSVTETYEYGKMPVFTGSTDKAQVGCTVYTFAGWDNEIVAVNGDATYTATYTESLSHTEGDTVEYVLSEGDCLTEGEKQVIVYCSVCGGEISNEIVFTGYGDHDWQDATCTEAKWCALCGETEGEALGHTAGETVVENVVAGDCVTNSSYDNVVYCSVCNEELSRDTIVTTAPGHTDGEKVIENNVNPDCTNPGSYDEVIYCTVCGAEVSRTNVYVPEQGHTAGETVVENNVAPDCVNPGSYDNVIYCTVCGEELSRVTVPVDALGHTAGETVVENNVAPDCTNPGSYDNVVYCSVCGEELSRVTVPVDALGHSYDAVVTAPTCTEDGYTTYTCSVCGDSYIDDEVAALGHTAGETVVENNVAPDCTNPGSYDNVVYCSVCGEELSRVTVPVDALGHTAGETVVENNVAPDCTNPGSYDNVVYCSVCGEELSRVTVPVDALGHAWGEPYYNWGREYGKPTPVQPYSWGNVGRYCPQCGKSETVMDHNLDSEIVSEGTCKTLNYVKFIAKFPSVDWAPDGIIYTPIDYNPNIHEDELTYINNGDTHTALYPCCNSVIIDSEAHGYSVGNYTCVCGAIFSGIFEDTNGDLYYVENGVAVENKGLVQTIDENGLKIYYYFGCGIEGCSAGDACQGNFKAQKSCRHYAGITNGYLVEGGYTIGDDGIIEHVENLQGIQTIDGTKFYLMDGVKVAIGLVLVDGEYYYARSNGALVVDQTYWVSKTNGLTHNGEEITKGSYTFDADGKIVWPVPSTKTGIYAEDGSLYYYVDGERVYAGLIMYTGDLNNADGSVTKGVYNNAMIYVNTHGEVKNNCTYWISKNNGLIAKNKAFTFDANGIVVENRTGFYFEDGYWYYYLNGSKNYAGLIWCDGPEGNDPGYYYVNSKCQLITDCTYWISKNNGIMQNQAYTFGANGKMVQNSDESGDLLNGFVLEGGKWIYYVDGAKNYAGLIWCEGPEGGEEGWYYVNSKCELITDCTYWISKNNGYMKNGSYTFDENGTMITE